ncbi:endo-1,4-beta-xylanase C [Xanthomonas phage SB3]|uniref:Endo-1,4-beta-xylanase C n=1 Tax=Xanthomonas phage SB3 TaxID=3117472 RepID=A0ABZ2GY38_9CAUD
MHFRLFDRPLIVDDPLSQLRISGVYDDYDPGTPYEGRVQIINSVGKCTVEVLDSNLPPGAFVYIDNISKEVVVKWPKYTPPVETISLLENGDFSQGDTGSWTNTGEGNPFVIEPDSDGNMSMKFKSGFYDGHFSRSPLAPVKNINRPITLTGQIAQGKSSKKKLLGSVLLVWFNEKREVMHWSEGNWVMSGGGYQEAKVIAAANHPDVKFVCAQIHFHRNGQNHPGWADNIKWDHVWEKGYNEDEMKFVTVRVTDALNNSVVHRGEIEERALWATSTLYPTLVLEQISPNQQLSSVLIGAAKNSEPMDVMTPGIADFRVTFKTNVNETKYPLDSIGTSLTIKSVSLKENVKSTTLETDKLTPGMSIKSTLLWRNAVNTAYPVEGVGPKLAITQVTFK